ncbi:MAG: ribonuclease P protein component [Candidatus Moraniibacteriota bacterium]|nr:MAG: ribonuclease P protein component [Candidatus Moranbacteria bacterium]
MFPKSWRLRTKDDFERVFRTGKPLFFGFVGCKIARSSQKHIRVGFSLSKKHLEKAATRNRLRRVISGACETQFSQEIRSQGYDIVFFTTKKPLSRDFRPFARVVQNVVEYIGT